MIFLHPIPLKLPAKGSTLFTCSIRTAGIGFEPCAVSFATGRCWGLGRTVEFLGCGTVAECGTFPGGTADGSQPFGAGPARRDRESLRPLRRSPSSPPPRSSRSEERDRARLSGLRHLLAFQDLTVPKWQTQNLSRACHFGTVKS